MRSRSPYKPMIGGPASGRPTMQRGKVAAAKKARRAIEGGGERVYLRRLGKKRMGKPYTGSGRSKGL